MKGAVENKAAVRRRGAVWWSFVLRHRIFAILFAAGVLISIAAAMGRATIYVADAHTQIVSLQRIDGLRTRVPTEDTVLCFLQGQRPAWSAPLYAPACGGLDAGKLPGPGTVLEIKTGSRAIVSRVGQGPMRVSLSSVDSGETGRIVNEGRSHILPALVSILLKANDRATSRIVTFRAAAEVGASLVAQRLVFGGIIEIQRSGVLTRDRFVARREILRTGDAVHFVRIDGKRAVVDGFVTFAPEVQGGLRASIQAKGSGGWSFLIGKNEEERDNPELVHGAEISRIGGGSYTLRAGFFDNLLADPIFSYLSAMFGLLAVIATILVINDQKSSTDNIK